MRKLLFLMLLSITLLSQAQDRKALHFDGENDYVSSDKIGQVLQFRNAVTVECIVKIDTIISSSKQVIFSVNYLNNNRVGNFSLEYVRENVISNDGRLVIYDDVDFPADVKYISTNFIRTDECYHIALVKNQETFTVFINGIIDGVFFDQFSFTNNSLYRIGNELNNGANENFFKGSISEFRIWNSARSLNEINQNMWGSVSGNEANLVTYYNFQQGVPFGNNQKFTQLNDFSQQSVHADLKNFSLTGAKSNFVQVKCSVPVVMLDCFGVENGEGELDSCGICRLPNDPDFNSTCKDCAGTVNGEAVIDSCGDCNRPDSPLFNATCSDCNGDLYGTKQLDVCGRCLEPNDPMFNFQPCGNNSCYFKVPNAFSPNYDGINDRFIMRNCGHEIQILSYQIFNRYGELVYENFNFDIDNTKAYWDGRINGRLPNSSGVYTYVVRIQLPTGEYMQTGMVTLLK